MLRRRLWRCLARRCCWLVRRRVKRNRMVCGFACLLESQLMILWMGFGGTNGCEDLESVVDVHSKIDWAVL